jgi:hypothetical protein
VIQYFIKNKRHFQKCLLLIFKIGKDGQIKLFEKLPNGETFTIPILLPYNP